MVLKSNPRVRRAKRTEGQSWERADGTTAGGSGNKAGTGRSLYRPYNLNFIPDLGACCKPGLDDDDVMALVVKLIEMVNALEFLKKVRDEQGASVAAVQENDDTKVGALKNLARAAVTATAADLDAVDGTNDKTAQVVPAIVDGDVGTAMANKVTDGKAAALVVHGVVNKNVNWNGVKDKRLGALLVRIQQV